MNINIDISDYLSEEEIKEECRSAIRACICQKYSNESELGRIISNLGYDFIFKAIQETTGEDSLQKIKDTVKNLVSKESTIKYELFKEPDAWSRSENVGKKILNEAIKEYEPLIKEKVKDAICSYSFIERRDLQTRMEDLFHEMLEEKLFNSKEEE